MSDALLIDFPQLLDEVQGFEPFVNCPQQVHILDLINLEQYLYPFAPKLYLQPELDAIQQPPPKAMLEALLLSGNVSVQDLTPIPPC